MESAGNRRFKTRPKEKTQGGNAVHDGDDGELSFM
jgi:hypothetical protein